MMGFRASGATGVMTYGYQSVARLARWELENDKVRAETSDVNDFWIEQGGPFGVRLRVGRKDWVWQTAEVLSIAPFMARVAGRPQVQDPGE